MKETVGDLFDYPADAIAVPVNWCVKRNGDAVMGAGVAKEAAKRWPWLPRHLGLHIGCQEGPPRLFIDRTAKHEQGGPEILGVPTKRDWRNPSDLTLIEQSARQLAEWVKGHNDIVVALPRLGCGLGGLRWEDVRAVLAPILDDRFVVLTREGDW